MNTTLQWLRILGLCVGLAEGRHLRAATSDSQEEPRAEHVVASLPEVSALVASITTPNSTVVGAAQDRPPRDPGSIEWVSPKTSMLDLGMTYRLVATAPDSLPVTFTLLRGTGVLRDDILTPTARGMVMVRADHAGNATWPPASLEIVFPVRGQMQTLSWEEPKAAVLPSRNTYRLVAKASSGLPVHFMRVSGPAIVLGDILTPSSPGTVRVEAIQGGDGIWEPTSSERSLEFTNSGPAVTLYVWPDSPAPTPPYTHWLTAAHDIQSAVDVAFEDDTVLVTNGVYETGSRSFSRIEIPRRLTLRSVNGPGVTVIRGAKGHEGGNGVGALRCVRLSGSATLSGFTLENGATQQRGEEDQWYENYGGGVLSEDFGFEPDQLGPWTGCVVTNCVLVGNSAANEGGGAYGGVLINCRLESNAARGGGAAAECRLLRCVVVGNTATGGSGGVYRSLAADCRLQKNLGGEGDYGSGGGAGYSTLVRCVIDENRSPVGGGACMSRLQNCLILRNTGTVGGGVYISNLRHCTVAGNTAEMGAAAAGAEPQKRSYLVHCIEFANRPLTEEGGTFFGGVEVVWSRTTSMASMGGEGNLTADPRFVNAPEGDYRLRPDSPCIDAGTNRSETESDDLANGTWVTSLVDLAGHARVVDGDRDGRALPDMGAYEFDPVVLSTLRATRVPAGVQLEWLPEVTGAVLHRTPRISPPVWSEVSGSETTNLLTVPMDGPIGFFRLQNGPESRGR